jgi:hypothetical protein
MERKSKKQSEATRNYKLIQRYSFEEKQLQEKLEVETCPVCEEKFENPQNCYWITCDCHNGGMKTADGFVVVMGCA